MATNLFSLCYVSPKEVAKRTWSQVRAADLFGRAAQLAYFFFLALFPFLICIIASLSVFGFADKGRALLFGLLAKYLTAPAYQLISNTFNQILRSSGPLRISFGLVASIWSASMGMSAVMDALNAANKVKESRSIIKQYIVAIGLTLTLAALIVCFTLIGAFGNQMAQTLLRGSPLAVVWKITLFVLAMALLLLALAITYFFAPNVSHPQWRWITPGASVGIVLLVSISVGLRIYIHYFDNYSATYGSLGAVIVLLLYFYLGGAAVLFGGTLNGVLEGLRPNGGSSELR